MKLIGLVGYAGSGKTTVAMELKKFGYIDLPLAEKLKNTCSEIFHINSDYFYDQELKDSCWSIPLVVTKSQLMNIGYVYSPFGVTFDQADSFLKKITIPDKINSPRHLLQFIGTDFLRSIDPDIHLKAAFKNLDTRKNYIISDIRFENEFAWVKEKAGLMIGIERFSHTTDMHPSEKNVGLLYNKCDFKIENHKGTIKEFITDINSFIEKNKKLLLGKEVRKSFKCDD